DVIPELPFDVGLVATQPLPRDVRAVERQREPVGEVRVDAGVDAVAGHQWQPAALANELRARRRRAVRGDPRGAEQQIVPERRVRVRVVDPGLEQTLVSPPQPDLDALPPRGADVLEEEPDRASGGDRVDVVLHVAAEQREVSLEPGPRLRAHADFVRAYGDRLERRIGSRARLEPGADRGG